MGPKQEGRLVHDQRKREQEGKSWKSASTLERQRKRAWDRQKGQGKDQQDPDKGKSKDKTKGQKGKDPKGAKGSKAGVDKGKRKDAVRVPPPPPPSFRAKSSMDPAIGPQNFKAPAKSGPKRQPPTPPAKRSKAEKSENSSEPSGLSVKEELPEAPAGNSPQGLRQEVATSSADAPAFAHAPNPEEPPSAMQEEAEPTSPSAAVVNQLAPGAETEVSASDSAAGPVRMVTTSPHDSSDTEGTRAAPRTGLQRKGQILSVAAVRSRRSQYADAPLAWWSGAIKAPETGQEEVRNFTGHLNRWPILHAKQWWLPRPRAELKWLGLGQLPEGLSLLP